jgi:hypothetical protein
MVNSFNKQQFSTFTGRASPIEDTKAKKITASVDAYESDFGTLKVVPNRFQRCTGLSDTVSEAFILQMDMWALPFLSRPQDGQHPALQDRRLVQEVDHLGVRA